MKEEIGGDCLVGTIHDTATEYADLPPRRMPSDQTKLTIPDIRNIVLCGTQRCDANPRWMVLAVEIVSFRVPV